MQQTAGPCPHADGRADNALLLLYGRAAAGHPVQGWQ